MNVVTGALRELAGLFVEDRSLTALILIVVAAAAALTFIFHASPAAVGGFLIIGALTSLAQSVIRSAVHDRRTSKNQNGNG